MRNLKKTAEELLSLAGVEINGRNPWDIQVHNDNFYQRVLSEGSLGLGESYMDAWWECKALDQFFYRIIRADLEHKVRLHWRLVLKALWARVFNLQSRRRAFQIGERHYDLGNDLFMNMLDKRMVYSCAYWKNARSLDEAQENKLELICRKIGLKQGMRVLDIGCGWGSFAKHAAEKYGAEVAGITVSKEQMALAKEMCKGLPVEIRLQDYRDIDGTFDSVVSVGMFEHVGYKNYRTFMKCVHRCLKDDGLFLLHSIGGNISVKVPEPWTNKYIFPNGMLPSINQIAASAEGLFVMEDWHNFSADYDKTLMAWDKRFEKSWDKIKGNYDERFYRMWKYFLLSSAGAFRARKNQLWQVVLSKHGVDRGYKSVR
ncbi:MAG: cyclopropane fatty acyl phospholipid synthase [candidate division WOR-3 bacterium]|nr:MAG: cyclopropane fatty acyl phospholipid synthase [candidate division WOR-3 bacterium]